MSARLRCVFLCPCVCRAGLLLGGSRLSHAAMGSRPDGGVQLFSYRMVGHRDRFQDCFRARCGRSQFCVVAEAVGFSEPFF